MNANKLPTNTEIDIKDLPQDMPGAASSPEQVPQSFSLKILLILAGMLLLSVIISSVLGILLGKSNKKTLVPQYEITKPKESLLVSLDVLQNPMFSEWSGKIKGRVKKVSENSIELTAVAEEFTDDGQRIIKDVENTNITLIQNIPGVTEFFVFIRNDSGEQGSTLKIPRTISDVLVGDILEGTVKIAYKGRLNNYDLIGKALSIRRGL